MVVPCIRCGPTRYHSEFCHVEQESTAVCTVHETRVQHSVALVASRVRDRWLGIMLHVPEEHEIGLRICFGRNTSLLRMWST